MKCCKRGKAPLEKWLRKQMNEYNSTSVQQKPPDFDLTAPVPAALWKTEDITPMCMC